MVYDIDIDIQNDIFTHQYDHDEDYYIDEVSIDWNKNNDCEDDFKIRHIYFIKYIKDYQMFPVEELYKTVVHQ